MAKPRTDRNPERLLVVRQRRAALLLSTALCATVTVAISLPAAAQPAPNARPTGGVVVGGNAAISQSASQTTIDQSSQRGAINWQTFNVGSQQSVQFNQPSSSAVTLNKVVGPNPSEIAGRIDANGQIVIQNQSGVTFYKGAQVNTAGLMVSAATSSDTATQAFLNGGKLAMDQAANPNAAVINQGQITIKQAGLAALVAPQVANSGVITAKLGHVELAGATKATLDLYGDGMLSIDVTGQVTKLPNGATALVTNSGVIIADGGTIKLTARAADGLVTTLVDAGGRIQANSVGAHIGSVTLNGVGGAITVEGQLDAIGARPGTKGGSIGINTTGNITIASGARINTSGQAGGGLVAIGTTLKRAAGGPAITAKRTAASVSVQPGAIIAASATSKGDGGRVTILSTASTDMAGTITAMGGPQGGNGGFVEISGNQAYSLTGSVNVTAPLGQSGTILIDPFDLTVVNPGTIVGTEDSNFAINGGTVFAGDGLANAPDTISNAVINQFGGNVELQAIHNLEVSAPISLAGTTATLTLRAGNDLTIDPGIAITTNNGAVLFTAADKTITGFNPAGSLSFGGTLNTGGAPATMSAGTGGIILNGSVAAGVLDLSTTGGGVVQTAGAINVATIQSSGGVTGDVSLAGVTSPLITIDNFAVAGGGFILINTGGINVAGALAATGNVQLQTPGTGGVSTSGIGGIISQTSGLIEIVADAANFAGTGKLTAATVELAPYSYGNTVTLGGPGGLSLSQASLSQISAQTLILGAHGFAPEFITTAGSINVTGSIDLAGIATTLDLHAAETVNETGIGSLNNVGTLTGVTGSVSLANGLDSGIGDIGNYAVVIANSGAGTGDFVMQNVSSTGISGPLSARNVSITETGSTTMNVTGTIAAYGTTSLTAGSIAFGAAANVQGTTITLNAATGITMTGAAMLGLAQQTNVLDITTTGGGFNEASNSTITAATLQSSGGVVGSASLIGGNAIGNVGNFIVTPTTPAGSADFILTDQTPLTVTGPLSATSGNIFLSSADPGGIGVYDSITASGRVGLQTDALTLAGSVTAGVFELAPYTQGGTLTVGTFGTGLSLPTLVSEGFTTHAGLLRLGAITLPGNTTPTITAGSIVVGGTFDALGGNLELDATGPINGAGAPLVGVGALSGSGTDWTLINNGNTINVLGNISAGNFALDDAVPLSVNGTVAAGSSAIIADTGSISVPGTVTAATVVLAGTDLDLSGLVQATTGTLVSTAGSIVEAGILDIGTLTGVATTTADLSGSGPLANQVGTIATFSAEGFLLRDGRDLSIANSLIAPNISILAPANRVSLNSGATIQTGGTTRAPGSITPANGGPGAYFQAASFNQIGNSSIVGVSGPATAQISVTGNIQFDPTLGLTANTTWLLLNLTNGTATGNVFVNALDVTYTQPGGSTLFGSIAGNNTGSAAAQGSILPAVNGNYTLNGCVIGSAVCLLPPTTPPIQPPPIETPPPPVQASTPPGPTSSPPIRISLLPIYTSVLGSLSPFLPGTPARIVALPNFVLIALPMLPAPPGQLTDPDVVPPNISFQDY